MRSPLQPVDPDPAVDPAPAAVVVVVGEAVTLAVTLVVGGLEVSATVFIDMRMDDDLLDNTEHACCTVHTDSTVMEVRCSCVNHNGIFGGSVY